MSLVDGAVEYDGFRPPSSVHFVQYCTEGELDPDLHVESGDSVVLPCYASCVAASSLLCSNFWLCCTLASRCHDAGVAGGRRDGLRICRSKIIQRRGYLWPETPPTPQDMVSSLTEAGRDVTETQV